ncbi:MAG: branched-chain amino acid aminotransferase [Rhizobiales bacterium]|nr:branched-chain amino acid aminotransferase [Hyphomicrobiales bacterium]MBI3674719.1 branched-chain amino acid aminotransferase [Hyphomicrobiales bacterium]
MPALRRAANFSRTWAFYEGRWHEGNVPIMGPRTHGAWLGSTLFDGARRFEGVAPDLDLHMARINASARSFGLKPMVSDAEWLKLAEAGMAKFDVAVALYIRPMYWAENGAAGGGVRHDPDSTCWCLCLYEAPMPQPGNLAITLSPFRRPSPDTAPVEAKAGCLYPNNARALAEAEERGFNNCLVTDLLGNVAELGNANVFMARQGEVFTPVANGTFLAGITRRRVIALLRRQGVTVHEASLRYNDFAAADEIFLCGNFSKLMPVTRIDRRDLQPGPFYTLARRLYWDFAHGRG